MRERPDFRGAAGSIAEFAPRFVKSRIEGFSKDMKICLMGIKSKSRRTTHAYFPALMSCCGTFEYLTSLYLGRTDPCGENELTRYAARFLPQPEYSRDMIQILLRAFRHPVAHRGIASGVWVDRNPANGGRRLTWKLGTQSKRPALALKAETGSLKKDSPWSCPYTHRMHIHLGRLWRDIVSSAVDPKGLCDELASNETARRNFESVMRHLYPQ